MEKQFSQAQLVNQILKIGHGDLSVFTSTGTYAAQNEPELFGHLISWNTKHGQVRDSKVALPILALRGPVDDQLYENAAANLCLLSPRDLVRATRFHRELPRCNGGGSWLKRAVHAYIRHREFNRGMWNATAVQHRKSLKTLYSMNHIKPISWVQDILFEGKYPTGSIFEDIKNLKNMDPKQAAGTILNRKIPFLIAVGAMEGIKDKPDVILAMISQMTKAELINNTAMLERWGVMGDDVLHAEYKAGLEKESKGKVSTLKAKQAVKTVKSKKAKATLKDTQEKELDNLKGIEGDWLIMGDRSGSMHATITMAIELASFMTRKVTGKVYLVMFNTIPIFIEATGLTLEQIQEKASYFANGGTSIGCGLDLIREKNLMVNGIAICSDGGDNSNPYFHTAYKRYVSHMGIEPTVYLYHVPGDPNNMEAYCERDGIQVETFEMGRNVDYYSIPQLALTMRTSRYALIEEILDHKLLTFNDVFKQKESKL